MGMPLRPELPAAGPVLAPQTPAAWGLWPAGLETLSWPPAHGARWSPSQGPPPRGVGSCPRRSHKRLSPVMAAPRWTCVAAEARGRSGLGPRMDAHEGLFRKEPTSELRALDSGVHVGGPPTPLPLLPTERALVPCRTAVGPARNPRGGYVTPTWPVTVEVCAGYTGPAPVAPALGPPAPSHLEGRTVKGQ